MWGCVLLSWWLVGAAWMSDPSQERLLAHSSLGSLWNPQMQSQFCAQESQCGPEWWCLSSRKPVWPLEDVCWGWREGRSSSDSTPGDQYPGFSLRADFHYWWKIISDLTVWRSLKKLRIKHDWFILWHVHSELGLWAGFLPLLVSILSCLLCPTGMCFKQSF